ncbi:unannotated protein [freshwater metagenome]|uniref:Unannotated protein n=1 Tax=freshwater metagenome TaxID=449393 RepID=A0A6J7JGG7_9ZZZZ
MRVDLDRAGAHTTAGSGQHLIFGINRQCDRTHRGHGDPGRRDALERHALDAVIADSRAAGVLVGSAPAAQRTGITTITILESLPIGIEIRIHLGPDPLVSGDERGERHDHSGETGEHGKSHSDTNPERHELRSVYPTPRTVWMSRLSPPSSVLRRRYPM